jgi:excinuclease UvrABC nuclease subunit
MSKKTVRMTNQGIDKLPQDKPVVYKILDNKGDNIYTGVAKRGNVQDRLTDHLPGHRDAIPGGAKVQIDQVGGIREAEKKEQNIIAHSKPKYNQQGK